MKVGDQVISKETRRNPMGGQSFKMLRFGNIMAIKDEKADVLFASANPQISRVGGFNGGPRDANQARKWVPLSELELASTRYAGRSTVQVDPARRSIGQLLNK